ncbi:hypothetical protein C7451_10578 [Blastomonas natatoria]|uniref:Uncharacterized protein n=1 Tax=Blastomonas natatoria TaxID=34015 RepID=A0A2V3V3Q9_9SPHN|nr:hypothetical protein C7451_10578 [Blastomonas natatoria]
MGWRGNARVLCGLRRLRKVDRKAGRRFELEIRVTVQTR